MAGTRISGILDVHIIQAENVVNICQFGAQDVYAKFLCGLKDPLSRVSLHTRTVKGGGRNPIFNQRLQVGIPRGETMVKCELWMASHNRGTADDEMLGYTYIPICRLLLERDSEPQDFVLTRDEDFLCGTLGPRPSAGCIKLALSYHPRGGQTSVRQGSKGPSSESLGQKLSAVFSKSSSGSDSVKRCSPNVSQELESPLKVTNPESGELSPRLKKVCLQRIGKDFEAALKALVEKQTVKDQDSSNVLKLGSLCVPDIDVSPKGNTESMTDMSVSKVQSRSSAFKRYESPRNNLNMGQMSPDLLRLWEAPPAADPISPIGTGGRQSVEGRDNAFEFVGNSDAIDMDCSESQGDLSDKAIPCLDLLQKHVSDGKRDDGRGFMFFRSSSPRGNLMAQSSGSTAPGADDGEVVDSPQANALEQQAFNENIPMGPNFSLGSSLPNPAQSHVNSWTSNEHIFSNTCQRDSSGAANMVLEAELAQSRSSNDCRGDFWVPDISPVQLPDGDFSRNAGVGIPHSTSPWSRRSGGIAVPSQPLWCRRQKRNGGCVLRGQEDAPGSAHQMGGSS